MEWFKVVVVLFWYIGWFFGFFKVFDDEVYEFWDEEGYIVGDNKGVIEV